MTADTNAPALTPEFLSIAEERVAYQHSIGATGKAGVLFLGGFASDMNGTKASFLAQRCALNNIGYLRFDYRGNGLSSGNFRDGTIGMWLEDPLAMFDQIAKGPQIIVGSSMGGWLGLILAMQRKERARAFIGIAAAPDFTEELAYKQMTEAQRFDLVRDGEISGGHAPLTLKLIDEARAHLILRNPIDIQCPVRLLQGIQDADVPWAYSTRITECIAHGDVRTTLIKDGDHRLSRDTDLELLWKTIGEFL